MKLIADVEIVNRLLPAVNLKSQSRPKRCQLSVGRTSSSAPADQQQIELIISSQLNRAGTSYKVRGNVAAVFMKFVHEGKCTIRLHEPPVDLCLSKADAIQLRGFMNVLKTANNTNVAGDAAQDGGPGMVGRACGLTSKQAAQRLRTKLVVTSRASYPLTTSFPSSLDTLTVANCALRIVDPRMLTLSRLVTLDLSYNRIATLPADWNLLPSLAVLKVSHNRIVYVPADMMTGSLQSTLAHLDLSDNLLSEVDAGLYRLHHLAVLKLDNNQLTTLPSGIGRLRRLVHLSASNNQLESIPGDVRHLCTLDVIDLSHNPLSLAISAPCDDDDDDTLTLFELAARAVLNQRVQYTSADIGRRLAGLLNVAECCSQCRLSLIRPHRRLICTLDLRRLAVSVTAVNGRMTVPTHCVVCSRHCATRLTATAQ